MELKLIYLEIFSLFNDKIQKSAKDAIKKQEEVFKNKEVLLNLSIAIGYGSRQEIANATKNIAKDVVAKKINEKDIDETMVSSYLYTKDLPDVDLLIRSSGEHRVSNFLLWQIWYAELYFEPKMLPDIKKEDFNKAILDYQIKK